MSRRKLKDKKIRKLARVGNQSISLTVPIEIVKKLKWKIKQKVVVSLRGKTISIKDWPSLRPDKSGLRRGRPASSPASPPASPNRGESLGGKRSVSGKK